MASRAQQKEEARQRRLAEEEARAATAQRRRRTMTLVGIVAAVLIVAAVVIVIAVVSTKGNSTGPKLGTQAASAETKTVNTLLSGIPQSGNALGSSSAKVTVTEFGDLECPICRDFALGGEQQLIQNDVRSGKVKLVYRSLCTATCNFNPSIFPAQQAAAIAAGQQNLEWYYVELFYHLQGPENTGYVTDSFLNGLAKQVPGLNYSKWLTDRSSATLTSQVTADEQAASAQSFNSTPTLVFKGPKGETSANGALDYSGLESAIKQVS